MSCCKCYLIDIACLRKYTKIRLTQGATLEHLQKEIILAHEVDVIALIGAECFDELCEAKAGDTLTPVQVLLIDLLTPYISFLVEYYFLNANIQYTAAGAVLMEGEGYSQPSGAQIQNAVEIARNNINVYRERIIKYLYDNKNDFPCYDFKECLDPCDVDGRYNGNSNIIGA